MPRFCTSGDCLPVLALPRSSAVSRGARGGVGEQSRRVSSRLGLRRASILVTSLSLTVTGCATSSIEDLRSASVLQLAPDIAITAESLISVEGAHPGSFRICLGAEGDRYAFARQHGENWSVVVDGTEGEQFEQLSETRNLLIPDRLYPGFSMDCSRFAYAGRRNAVWHVVVDQKTWSESFDSEPVSILKSFDDATPRISPWEEPPEDLRIVEKDRERFVVADGKELKHYSVGAKGGWLEGMAIFICAPAQTDCSFTGNGPLYPIYRDATRKRVGYQVARKSRILYVVDEVEYGPYDPFLNYSHGGPIIFSSDGEHFAFQAMRDGRAILNIDGTDTLSLHVLRYREPGVLVRSEMVFPYKFLGSNQLQIYAIKKNQLMRFSIDIAD